MLRSQQLFIAIFHFEDYISVDIMPVHAKEKYDKPRRVEPLPNGE